jgi:hypothetical protein
MSVLAISRAGNSKEESVSQKNILLDSQKNPQMTMSSGAKGISLNFLYSPLLHGHGEVVIYFTFLR